MLFDQVDFVIPDPTPSAVVPMSAAELMATPEHMLAWLRAKAPDEIVSYSMGPTSTCLGGVFFAANGHAGKFPTIFSGRWPWFNPVFSALCGRGPVTATQAIAAILAAEQVAP